MREHDFEELAAALGIEKAVLMAVAEVESGRNGGFLPDGRAVILFEAHIFWRRLQRRGIDPEPMAASNPDILSPRWDRRLYRDGAAEWERMERAATIDRAAALESASWGAFQIMGFNYARCSVGSIDEFVDAMGRSRRAQLELFGRFLQNSGLVAALRTKDWINFAKRYNGRGYAANRYDVRLSNAYAKYACTNG